jgi:hypothetical protein
VLPVPRDTSEEVEQEAARVVSRLGTLAPARVPVDVVREAVQRLADLSRAAEGLDPLPVPDLAPHGWVDLLRVVVGDLLEACSGRVVGPDEAERLLVAARDILTDLRRSLP